MGENVEVEKINISPGEGGGGGAPAAYNGIPVCLVVEFHNLELRLCIFK